MNMIDLIAKLSPLRMAPNSHGLDQCVEILKKELPFEVHEVPGGEEHNGWVVPQKWEVIEAKIFSAEGELLYDGMGHPLGVIGYSQSFEGCVSAEELKEHLFYPRSFDDALVYHCDLFYKPFKKDWGFSVTKNFFDNLPSGQYKVTLKTTFEKGSMKISEFVLPGDSKDSIVFNAHNCHAFCCNDDLSGVAVGVELMRQLKALKFRRFTYRLIIAPEHFGSIFYLKSLSGVQLSHLKCGIFLEMLGAGGPLALQRSFIGNHLMDHALWCAASRLDSESWSAPFRKIVGNDETCWEAPGYEIPFPSLSRSSGNCHHFPEYHTSRDGPELIEEAKLLDAVKALMDALFILENDCVMKRKFKGLIALSHPKYDLYFGSVDPSIRSRHMVQEEQKKWNHLMDCLPRYFDGKTRLLEVTVRHDLPFAKLFNYVKKFAEKGLVDLEPASVKNLTLKDLPPL